MKRASLAAVTLSSAGGGVAAVSRLMWRVFQEHWNGRCALVELMDGPDAVGSLHPTMGARLRFGGRLLWQQAWGRAEWTFYTHLSLARVQDFVPPTIRRPYAVFLHGIEVWRPLSASQRRILERASLRVANSAYTARRVTEAHPWIGRIDVCPLALPSLPPSTGPSSGEGTRIGDQAVLIVGRMSAGEQYKGHDQLLDAWPSVLRRHPNAQLVVVGTGDDVVRLKQKARDLGVGERVVFTGFVSDEELGRFYARAAVFAMPSRDEGFGLVYLEAMAHRLPCIGSRHDAAAEVIEDGVTGFLIDQSDVVALAERVVDLLGDAARRTEMGARGHARVAQRFSYGAFRDRLLALTRGSFGDCPPPALVRAPSLN